MLLSLLLLERHVKEIYTSYFSPETRAIDLELWHSAQNSLNSRFNVFFRNLT